MRSLQRCSIKHKLNTVLFSLQTEYLNLLLSPSLLTESDFIEVAQVSDDTSNNLNSIDINIDLLGKIEELARDITRIPLNSKTIIYSKYDYQRLKNSVLDKFLAL